MTYMTERAGDSMEANPQQAGAKPGTETPFISLDNITIGYGDHTAVRDITLTIGSSDFLCLIGPSGCGKSSLLHVVAGLRQARDGSLRLSGKTVDNGLSDQIRVGYVFQDHRLLPWRTVRQNIEIAMKSAGIPRSEWEGRVTRYLSMLQVGQFADSWPLRLSGGQRQRVSIARALAIDPDVVLMDEPFSGLDEVTGRAMRQELVSLWQETQIPIVFVTHSIREALFLADRVVVLSRGPATVVKEITVPVQRPRAYEDPELAELEASVVADVVNEWGIDRDGGTTNEVAHR